jgi:hypothetical protein
MDVYQCGHPIAVSAAPGIDIDQVYASSWASNIGRPYELIANRSKRVSIWHIELHLDK